MNTSPSATRRARERLQVRDRILDAARELFAAEGYEAVTMRRIAERIEYTPPVIYQHFADKAALIRELCALDFRLFARNFQRLAAIPDPIERLGQMGRGYIEFALTHPNHYRVMFMGPGTTDPEVRKDLDPEARGNPELDAYAFLRQAVEEAFAAGRFNPDLGDPGLIAHVLWLGVHGIASMHVAKPHPDLWPEYRDPLEVARLQAEAVMRGLTCDVRTDDA